MVANNNNSNNKKNNAAIKSSSSPHNNNNHNNNNNNKGNINKSPKSPSGRDSVLHSKSQQNFQYSNNRRSPKHQKTGNSNTPQSKYPRKAIDKFNDQTFSEAPEETLGNFVGGSFVEAGSTHQSANNRIELSRPHLSTSTPTSISIRDFKDGYFVTRPSSSSPPNNTSSSSSSSEASKEKTESVFVTPAKLKDNNLPLPLLSEAPTPSSVRNVQNFILSATSLPPSSSFSTSSSSPPSSSPNSSFDSLVSTSLPNLSFIQTSSTPPSVIITNKQLNHSPPRSTSPLSSSILLSTPPSTSSSSPSSPTIITHRKVRSRSDIKSSPSSAFAHYANPPPPTHIPIPSFS